MKIRKFKPLRKKDTLLYKLIIGVAAIHAIALLILGGIVVSEIILEPETAFEAPPPPEKVEPKKNFQTQAKQRQQSSNKLVKRIQIPKAKMQNVSTATINLPSSDIAGGGSIGGGLEPKGFGDLNIAMTSVSLLGVKSKTQKIVILIDASRYMMTDEKGALNTYNVIKDEITNLVNSLPAAVLFNVIAYSQSTGRGISINAFSPNLLSASAANKEKLYAWLMPINSSLDKLEVKGNYNFKYPALPELPSDNRKIKGGYSQENTRQYKAYHAAMEQGADTIYILTDRWTPADTLRRPFTQKENDDFDKKVAKHKADHEAEIAAINKKLGEQGIIEAKKKEEASYAAREKARNASLAKGAAWIEAENARRKKNGISLYVGTSEQAAKAQGLYYVPRVERLYPAYAAPKKDTTKTYTAKEVADYFVNLIKKDSDPKYKIPTLNMILFKGQKENNSKQVQSAQDLVKVHRGKLQSLVGSEL